MEDIEVTDMKVRGQLGDDAKEMCIITLDCMIATLSELDTSAKQCGKSSTILVNFIKRTIFESYKAGLLDGSIEFVSTTHALLEIEVAISSIFTLGIDTID